MILRTIRNLAQRTIETNKLFKYKFPNVQLYQFSEDNEPKGFSKFKKKKKEQSDEGSKDQKIINNKEDIKPDQNEKEEQKIDQKKDDMKQNIDQKNEEQEKVEQKNEKDENKTEKKKKINFTYSAKFFGFGDNKKDKQKPEENKNNDSKEDQSDQQSSQNKQEGDKGYFGSFTINQTQIDMRAVIAVGLGLGITLKLVYDNYYDTRYINYKEFVTEYLEPDKIKKIKINRINDGSHFKTFAIIYTNDEQVFKMILGNVDHFLENLEKFQIEKGRDQNKIIPVDFEYKSDANKIFDRVVNLIYLGATLGIMYALFRSLRATLSQVNKGGDVFGMGKSNVKVFGLDTQIKIKFKDVAGLDEAKQEVTEFVDFLKKPKKYKDIGAKLPKGALLSGPPGTGKTMLAKACAGEANVPFFYISGSDFVEMFVGVGASRVRDLFKQAKQKSPSIIFIDEIDAVGRKRESRIGGNDERDNTLNQLLVEMDGFGTDSNVIVLAATNRKELLDPALTRPGRFDRTIEINLPDLEGRKSIFMVHLKPLKIDPIKTIDEYAKRLSTLTPGFSGADIANLCNEAAILAARKNKKCIESIDFEMASERILGGLEKKRIVSYEERKIVAVHESGHAIVSWFLEGGNPLVKITIIPRSKGSLGFAQYLPNEGSLESKEELFDRLCSILGGRVAEEEFFGKITTGAYDDLKKAYEMAYAMVSKYGMSEKIGYVGYVEGDYNKSYSDQTNKLIDDEIKVMIHAATEKTKQVIREKKAQVQLLSDALLEKETLDLRSIRKIIGDRPFPPKQSFKAFLDTQDETEQEIKDQGEKEKQALEKEKNQTTQTQEATISNN